MIVVDRPETGIPVDNRILYYTRDRHRFRFLSHFYASPIIIDDEEWSTVEHYYQAQKSANPEYKAAIRAAVHPGWAKRLAAPPSAPRRISRNSWFRQRGEQPRPDWHDVKLDIMRRADQAKFAQNVDLAVLLLATGEAELIEDSPTEPFWGIGPDGAGLNWAGRVLMEVRSLLRSGGTGGPTGRLGAGQGQHLRDGAGGPCRTASSRSAQSVCAIRPDAPIPPSR